MKLNRLRDWPTYSSDILFTLEVSNCSYEKRVHLVKGSTNQKITIRSQTFYIFFYFEHNWLCCIPIKNNCIFITFMHFKPFFLVLDHVNEKNICMNQVLCCFLRNLGHLHNSMERFLHVSICFTSIVQHHFIKSSNFNKNFEMQLLNYFKRKNIVNW